MGVDDAVLPKLGGLQVTIVAAYLYRQGRRVREIAIDEKFDCPTDRCECVWIGVCDPITRQLAAWAAILAVPTAIAGIYGMNFEHMPELTTQYGYFIVLGVIMTMCVMLYARFRYAR